MLNKYISHQHVFIFFLCVLAFGVSMGKIFMSISIIGISINWILSLEFNSKWQRIKNQKFSPLIATTVFFISFIWVPLGDNLNEGIKDLTMKLPFLALPLILGSSQIITKKQWLIVLGFFLSGIWINSAIGIFKYLSNDFENYRDLSIFISHIRLGILLGISTLISLLGLNILKPKIKYSLLLGLVLILVFTRILESGTGYLSVAIALILGLFYAVYAKRKKFAIVTTSSLILLGTLTGGLYSLSIYKNMTTPSEVTNINELPVYTAQNNLYIHNPELNYLENGHYIYLNICEPEVQQAWDTRSDLDFYTNDKNGQSIQANVYRYLTSKGERKDYETVMNLSNEEITAIENGQSSIAEKRTGLGARIEEILFEYISFQNGFDPNGHSMIQRLYYLEAGWSLFSQNKLMGHTKSDENNAYQEFYNVNDSPLKLENRMPAHNQFLSFLVCYGLIGFIMIIGGWIYPYLIGPINFLAFSFILFMLVGFVFDDMLYRQAGVTIFAFFYSLFLFQTRKDWAHISTTS